MIDWQLIFYSVFLLAGLAAIACQIILRLTLDRRVRKELPASKTYDSFYDNYFGIWRAMLFANTSILKSERFKNTMAIFYEGFDVTNFANPTEKIVAWIHLIAGVILFSCLTIYFFTNWLGILEWSTT